MCSSFLVSVLLITADAPQRPAIAPAPRAVAKNIRNMRPTTYYGEVMAVPRSNITIRGNENNDKSELVSRTFRAGTALQNGDQEPSEKSECDYRLQDVKVGDIVVIVIHQIGEDDVCAAVRIQRRPGGLVPKAPFEDPEVRDPYHVMMNAFQRFEEKGIPLPLKYDPNYISPEEVEMRLAQTRLRERLNRNDRMRLEGRIAPMPRPVVRK